MGEDSLVDSMIARAERIVPRLRERGITVLAAFVAFEIEAEQWMLLVATSKDDSKLAIYNAIQSTARELEIYINLSQVVHMRDGDPSIDLLRAAAMSQRYAKSYPPVEFGSWSFMSVHGVSTQPWRIFELEVFDAIQKIARTDWQMSSPGRSEGYPPVEIDITIENADTTVAVEVMQHQKPVGVQTVMTELGKLQVLQRRYENIRILLISRSGFLKSALAIAEPFQDIRLLSWESVQVNGLGELRIAINDLLTPG
ncbi:hypothetical protein OG563_26820 [Nocardia vinacea]|uniref:Restriction endonuclease type IV Mrr domain-containing protein n=1 Tax=Nocardia vinacea TaxID=96468 RepID=A0ABZ1YLJ9_9NOCA|nr:hypothetical protein [Nocardia vinacea]